MCFMVEMLVTQEDAERIFEQLRQTYGEMNIAVDLIRETRDEG